MNRFSLTLVGCLAVGCAADVARAEPAALSLARSGPLLPAGVAERLDLVRPWFIQVSVDSQRGVTERIGLHTSRTRYFTVYRVNYQGRGVDFSEQQLGSRGEPIGLERARQLADIKMRGLRELGYAPQLETVEVPQSILYVQTNLGALHAVDAHTGRTLWTATVGRADFPSVAPAANDKLVVTCTGSDLVWLDAETGRVLYRRQAAKIPFGDLAITDQFVVLPTLDGTVEVYKHSDKYSRTPWRLTCDGLCRGAPLVTDSVLAWVTDHGVLYVAHPLRTGLLFDVQFDGPGVGSPAAVAPGLIVVATANGFVYGVDQRNGGMVWRYTVGDDIVASPLAIQDQVFIATRSSGVYSLKGDSGELLWTSRDMDRALAANADHLYGRSRQGCLVMLDRHTGQLRGALYTPELDLSVPNSQTDRLFVGTRRGLLECLHDPKLPFPLVYVERKKEAPAETPPQPATQPAPATGQPAAEPQGPINPFEQLQPGRPPGAESQPPADQPPADEGQPENPFGPDNAVGPFGGSP